MIRKFWHLTTRSHLIGILDGGIKMSEDGNIGQGVYCVLKGDTSSLAAVVNLESYSDSNINKNDMIVIEFEYSGEYTSFNPDSDFHYRITWCKITSNISISDINKILYINDIF